MHEFVTSTLFDTIDLILTIMQSLSFTENETENETDHSSLKRSQLQSLSDSKRSHVEHSDATISGGSSFAQSDMLDAPYVKDIRILGEGSSFAQGNTLDGDETPPTLQTNMSREVFKYAQSKASKDAIMRTISNSRTISIQGRLHLLEPVAPVPFANDDINLPRLLTTSDDDDINLLPNSLITIGDGAFTLCTDLASVEIPNSVITIGEGAFTHCTGLASVVIPDSVTTIGANAFIQCTGLTEVVVPDHATIGDDAFPDGVTLTLSSEVVEIQPLK